MHAAAGLVGHKKRKPRRANVEAFSSEATHLKETSMQTMSQQAVKVKSTVVDVLKQRYYARIERDPRMQRVLQLLDEKLGPVGSPPVRQRPVLRLIQGGLV